MFERKTKIFISYSHEDASFMHKLGKHLVIPGLDIEVFTDEDIRAGQPISTGISEGIHDADIAVFLLSADFLNSEPCMKEWGEAKATGTVRIPVVARDCSWKQLLGSDDIKVLPKDGKPIIKYDHEDTAYQEISRGIAAVVRERETLFSPKKGFRGELEDTEFASQEHLKLQDIFVFPNLELEVNDEESGGVVVDSHEDILEQSPVFIHGEQSSGKTALAKHLCLHFLGKESPVLYMDLRNKMHKVASRLFEKEYEHRFNGKYSSWKQQKNRLVIMDNMSSAKEDMSIVLLALEHFDKVVVILDSDTHQAYYKDEDRLAQFSTIAIRQLTRVKQEELIRKRISVSDNKSIDAKIDHVTNKVDMIILKRIVPRYPFFVLTAVQTFEGYMPNTLQISSYASCYYVAILALLEKSGIDKKEGSINECMNYMRHLAFAIYDSERFSLSLFNKAYRERFVINASVINRLMDGQYGIIDEAGMFRVDYAYYYFLGAYLAENISHNKEMLEKICEKSFTTENHLILIFFVHHCHHKNIIDDILIRTMCTLDKIPPAKLTPEETKIFDELIKGIKTDFIAGSKNVQQERKKAREMEDKHEQQMVSDEVKSEGGIHDDIYRVLKTNELLKQILHNHYGEMEKSRIAEVVHAIIESGLRLVRLLLINEEDLHGFADYVQKKYPDADASKVREIMCFLSFIWTVINIEKIVDTVSLPEIRTVIKSVIDMDPTPAYQIIGYFNQLDVSEDGINAGIRDHLKKLIKEHGDNAFYTKLLSMRTQRYMRTHRGKAPQEQAVCSLLGIKYKDKDRR